MEEAGCTMESKLSSQAHASLFLALLSTVLMCKFDCYWLAISLWPVIAQSQPRGVDVILKIFIFQWNFFCNTLCLNNMNILEVWKMSARRKLRKRWLVKLSTDTRNFPKVFLLRDSRKLPLVDYCVLIVLFPLFSLKGNRKFAIGMLQKQCYLFRKSWEATT